MYKIILVQLEFIIILYILCGSTRTGSLEICSERVSEHKLELTQARLTQKWARVGPNL